VNFTAISLSTILFFVTVIENINYGGEVDLDDVSADPVPEPAAMILLGSDLAGLVVFRKRLRHLQRQA